MTRLSVGLIAALVLILAGTAYTVNRPGRDRQSAPPTAGVITGRVLTPEGQPVPGARVSATNNKQVGRLPTSLTDEQGTFSITGLAPGTYELEAEKEEDDYPSTGNVFYTGGLLEVPHVTIAEGQTSHDVTVRLGPKAARVEGRILDAARNLPVRNSQGIQLRLSREDGPQYSYATGSDSEGNFSILVPEEPFTIEVSAPGYKKHRSGPLRFTKGQLKRLDIPLQAANTAH